MGVIASRMALLRANDFGSVGRTQVSRRARNHWDTRQRFDIHARPNTTSSRLFAIPLFFELELHVQIIQRQRWPIHHANF
jgi:hypothetical protein